MATKSTATGTGKPTEAVKQITYLATALKAPRITEAAARLADQGGCQDFCVSGRSRRFRLLTGRG